MNGLADENVRWANTIQELKESTLLLIGDVLLASAFISYIGPFTRAFRTDLVTEKWSVDIKNRGIPFTDGLDPVLNVMTDEAEVSCFMSSDGARHIKVSSTAVNTRDLSVQTKGEPC